MLETRKAIFDELEKERAYQEEQWGRDFDKNNTINDWATYIMMYTGDASKQAAGIEEWRMNMIKVAALAIAAVEIYDEGEGPASRHYDK